MIELDYERSHGLWPITTLSSSTSSRWPNLLQPIEPILPQLSMTRNEQDVPAGVMLPCVGSTRAAEQSTGVLKFERCSRANIRTCEDQETSNRATENPKTLATSTCAFLGFQAGLPPAFLPPMVSTSSLLVKVSKV